MVHPISSFVSHVLWDADVHELHGSLEVVSFLAVIAMLFSGFAAAALVLLSAFA
jgi:hypothetical protein